MYKGVYIIIRSMRSIRVNDIAIAETRSGSGRTAVARIARTFHPTPLAPGDITDYTIEVDEPLTAGVLISERHTHENKKNIHTEVRIETQRSLATRRGVRVKLLHADNSHTEKLSFVPFVFYVLC